MSRLYLGLCLALFLASPCLAAPIPITGWVGDAHGMPLAGARVTLSPLASAFEGQRLGIAGGGGPAPEPTQKTASDAAGAFTFAVPDAGMWTVRVEAAGAVPFELDLVPLVETEDLPPFPTAIAEDAGVEIRVVDGQGRPVPAARVVAQSSTSPESTDSWHRAIRRGETGPEGRLRLPRVRGERLKIRASAPGYPVTEIESGEEKVLLRLSPALPRTVLVRGADGSPVAGALVAAGPDLPAAARTDEGGRATIFATAKKVRPVAWTADGRRSTAVILPPEAPTEADPAAPLAIRLPRLPERMSGQVVDRLDRQPLAGALVWSQRDRTTWVRADARGGYAILPAREGKTALAAAAPGHLPAELTALPPARGERALHGPTFALEPAVAAEGVVVDAAGKPLAGAFVSAAVPGPLFGLTAPKPRGRSGPEGRFTLRPLAPAQPYEVTATLRGFATTKITLAELRPQAVRSGLRLLLRRGRTVRGRVVDGAGQPVAAAVFQIAAAGADLLRGPGADRYFTRSDAAGQFAVEGLLPGKFDLAVQAPGFALASRRQVAIPAGEKDFDLGAIALGRGISVAGIVVDREGRPVAEAAVHVQTQETLLERGGIRQERGEASTGADGRFVVTGLSRGPTFVLRVERDGFASRTVTEVKPPLAEPLRIVLSPASRLAGSVVDDAGAAVPAARIGTRGEMSLTLLMTSLSAAFPSATADDDGHFELRDAPTGKLTVSVRAAGFLPASLPVEIAPGQSRDDLRVVLRRGSTVAGRVLGPDGTPAAGAEVSLAAHGRSFVSSSGVSTRTDGDGAYTLDAVPPGPQSFTAELPGAVPTVRDLAVRPGENRLDFKLGPGLEIAGRVVDDAGAPLGGARVALSAGDSLPHETASGDDGSFHFPGLRGGAYRLSAQLQGFATVSQEVRLADAPRRDVELRLGSGGAVAGRILGLSPEQLAQVRVLANRAGEGPGSSLGIEADPKGEYRIGDLSPGEWTVIVTVGLLGRSARGQVQLPPGVPEVRLDLEFPSGFTLSGRLLRAGQPLPGALVGVQGTDVETNGLGRSDTQGGFRIDGLQPGTYELTVRSLAAGQLHKESLDITANREVEIDLPAAEVRGKVVDADDGSPIAEATIALEQVQPDGAGIAGLLGRVQTGPDGAFVVEGGAEGDYRVVARKDGYAPAEAPVHLAAGGGVDDVKLSMTPATGLRFTVRDATGNPPPAVSAALLDPAGRVLLAGNYPVSDGGRVRISEAPTGHWLLLVAAGNTATTTVAVDVPGPRPAVDLPDRTRLTILVPELVGKPGRAGLQITGADGLPYRSLRFGFLFQNLEIGGGRLELDDLPPGAWQVRVEVPGGKVRQGIAVTSPSAPAQVVWQ
jgi:protocatechuate 3,4-dioxygenase beta subunit